MENNHTGKLLHLSDGIIMELSYGILREATDIYNQCYEYKIVFDKTVEIKEAGIKVTLLKTGGDLLVNHNDDIIIRNRRDGDRFYPEGMEGSKKLKDYFTDKKIPSNERNKIPLLVINNKIASVIGYRNDKRFSKSGGECLLVVEKI